jgi:hypothetical protein
MVKYTCIYCKKIFLSKYKHDVHNEKKKNCEYLFNLKKRYYLDYFLDDIQKEKKKVDLYIKKIKIEINKIQDFLNNNEIKCKKCNKDFKTVHGLKKHIFNNLCKNNKNKYDILVNKQKNINNGTVNNTNNNNTNNTNNINNINNITINNKIEMIPFRFLTYNKFPKKLQKEILEQPGLSIQRIVLHMHFNQDKPEQMNILYCNRRDSNMLVYDKSEFSTGWATRDKDEMCELIVTKALFALEDIKNKNEEDNDFNIAKFKINATKSLINDVDNDYKSRKDMKKNISNLCYDNHEIVKKNKSKQVKKNTICN